MQVEIDQVLLDTIVEVGATKQDILPAAGFGITVGGHVISQSTIAGIMSILIGSAIVLHKVFQIWVLYQHNKREQEKHDER